LEKIDARNTAQSELETAGPKGTLALVGLFSAAIVATALCHAQRVHATPSQGHEFGCSVASLKGTYAWRRTGVNKSLGGPIAEMGLNVFNGDGKLGVTRSTGISYDQSYDWTNGAWPDGSYTVDPDCTGSFFDANGTKTNNIIVIDGGKRFLLISFEPDKVVTAEGIRLEEEKD
jgi:hypothetical protein